VFKKFLNHNDPTVKKMAEPMHAGVCGPYLSDLPIFGKVMGVYPLHARHQ